MRWLPLKKNLYIYGIKNANGPELEVIDKNKLVWVDQYELTNKGIEAQVKTPWGEGYLFIPLLGLFNLQNALAVLTVMGLLQYPFKKILKSLAKLSPVPGRMQTLGGVNEPTIVIDYSHTPDALLQVLKTLKMHTTGNICCVFGCGGDRDTKKRPLMGKVVEQFADHIIVTNDNPRHEDPQKIIDQILLGFQSKKKVQIELDRSKAIEMSIQWAKPGDCVLIAGKGAEKFQQIDDEKIPFNDCERAEYFLKLKTRNKAKNIF